MGKKYISKIVKGGNTIYMKDAEAQTAIANVASESLCEEAAEEIVFESV